MDHIVPSMRGRRLEVKGRKIGEGMNKGKSEGRALRRTGHGHVTEVLILA